MNKLLRILFGTSFYAGPFDRSEQAETRALNQAHAWLGAAEAAAATDSYEYQQAA